jgi:MoxR-like ATPase
MHESRSESFTAVELGGVRVLLPNPSVIPCREFIGREAVLTHCLAAWLPGERQPPCHFRLVGPPGVGKNEVVDHLARQLLQLPLYVMQGHEEVAPEDIACTARITENQQVEYVGSPLLAAMVRGGICFFDEIGKIPHRSLSLLASVLDDRRTLTSTLAGFTVQAADGFRFCAAMNDGDAAIQGLPDYIDDRLRPILRLEYPPLAETLRIVESRCGATESSLLEAFRRWAAGKGNLTPRTALALLHFAQRLHQVRGGESLDNAGAESLLSEAALLVIGTERTR